MNTEAIFSDGMVSKNRVDSVAPTLLYFDIKPNTSILLRWATREDFTISTSVLHLINSEVICVGSGDLLHGNLAS